MKKRRLFASMMTACLCASLCLPVPTMADSRKVVTLGVDLSEEQQNKILKYFGVTLDAVDVIYINNQQERDALGSYIPLEQIGTHTYSCAMVNPTTSGGIQVKTANLNYVTCNMIASTLSTSGVTNCQVLAAAPFEVSGTGALTGITLAYEKATETTLDPVKKDLANQEIIVTGDLSESVGQSTATAVITETKENVIEGNVTDIGDIGSIVNNVTNEYNVELTDEEKAQIAELMQKIAQQDYDIAQMKANLDKVQANVIGDTQASDEKKEDAAKKAEESAAEALKVAQQALELAQQNQQQSNTETPVTEAPIEGSVEIPDEGNVEVPATEGSVEVPSSSSNEGSILDNTDVSALEGDGAAVNEGTTTQTVEEQKADAQAETEDLGIPDATGEVFTEAPVEEEPQETEGTESVEVQEETEPVYETDAPETETAETSEDVSEDYGTLSDEDYEKFMGIKTDLDAEFLDMAIPGDDGITVVYLSDDTCKTALANMEAYVAILLGKGADVVAEEEDADPSISNTVLEDTASIVEVKNYEDKTMVQLDKFARRYILQDCNEVFKDSELTDLDKVVVYKTVMGIFEDHISSEVAETEPTEEDMMQENEDTGLEEYSEETYASENVE